MGIKRLFGIALMIVLMLSVFTAFPTVAFAEDSLAAERTNTTPTRVNYDVKISVKVTEDANGWNDAWIAINQKYACGTSDKTGWTQIYGLKDDFDNKTEFSHEKKRLQFPTSVDIYTDFGGGATWRAFQADVTVYINGVNVASKHITAKSTAFSSSDTTNTITIDESKYPYPKKVYVKDAPPETVQLKNGSYSKEICATMVDQYGSSWESDGVTLTDSDGKTIGNPKRDYFNNTLNGKTVEYFRYFTTISVKSDKDKKVTYTYTIPTANSAHSKVTASFTVQYKCVHKVDIVFDGAVKDTKTGVADSEISLNYPDLVADGFDIEWSLEGGGVLDANNADGAKYVFGSEDGILTAKLVPYSFTVAFDGNGATKGTMASKIQRVGTTYTLPGNTFSNTGHEFTGWNTRPDGSGDSYANKSTVQDLSTVKDDVVTLYAQWKVKTYTVTFVNKMTGDRMKQTVEYGQDAEPPEIEPVSVDENEHYIFSKWNKAYTGVKSNITVTSVHVKEAHTFVDEGDEHYCSVCGYGKTEADADADTTASVFGNGGIIAIVVIVAVMAAAAVVAVIIKKRKNQNAEEKECK